MTSLLIRTMTAATLVACASAGAWAQGLKETPDSPTDLTNALDGDANIAGTDAAIDRSNIPMEGAVADTMGEALALDKATDRYETGRPLVVLKDGYEKLDFTDSTFANFSDAPVFGLDDREIGRIERAGRNADGEIEGVVVIDGGDEPRRVRVGADRMSGLRGTGGDVRVYLDGSDEALAGLPDAG